MTLEALDDGYGNTILSRDKAKRGLAWGELASAFKNKATIKGVIIAAIRGGFSVNLGILQGFLPGSQIDTNAHDVENLTALKQQTLDFQILNLDYHRNNIIVSRNAVLRAEGYANREVLLNQLEERQVLTRYVKNLADYGAFINLGGIDGLLHNSDIAWEKTTAREWFKNKLHDPVEVVILKLDKNQERPRISLGIKQLEGDPWIGITDRYAVGMRLEKRKVTHIKD